jgi:transposase-like protein
MSSPGSPDDHYLEFLRSQRYDGGVTCPHCGSDEVARKGLRRKTVQQYYCHECETYFNDLTGTVFAGQRLSLEEMFYIIQQMDQRPIADVTADVDRTYKTVLEFAQKARERRQADTIVSAIQDHPRMGCDIPPGSD